MNLASVAVLASFCVLGVAADPPANDDAERVAGSTPWAFDRGSATPAGCAARGPWGRYAISVEGDEPFGARTLVVSLGDAIVHRVAANAGTVFAIVGDRLYYAVPEMGSQGGEVVAVDLAIIHLGAGGERWRKPLTGLPPVAHSKYSNRLNLGADARWVTVFGEESAGRYVELKDVATGATVGHRVYPVSDAEPERSGP